MKPYLNAARIIMLLFHLFVQSQTLIKCDDGKTFWLIPDTSTGYYAVKLHGDIDLSEQPDILNINDKALQYIVLEKSAYVEEGNKNSDKDILNRFVTGETAYLRERYGENLEIYSEMHSTADGQDFILWRYFLPAGNNKEVTSLVFANVVWDNEIFGLGSPQFANMEIVQIKNLLINAISTVIKTPTPHLPCK